MKSLFPYEGNIDDVFRHYPLPPSTPPKKGNCSQRRRRPGRRLVPFNKIDIVTSKLDSNSDKLEEIDEVLTCSTSKSAYSETQDEDREMLEQYIRVRPGPRGAVCESLEEAMNIVKINGKKYNLSMMRKELVEMMNAVNKYDSFFKTLKLFRG
jgi:hypothetical protein